MELWGQHFYKLLENMSKNLNKKNMAIAYEQIEQEILLRSKKEFSRKAPPKDFKDLPEIPAERYVNESFNDLEKDALWNKCWLYAAHTDQIKNPGDFLLWKDAGVPIIIVRAQDNQIRAFYNTCRHRGSSVVREDSGNTKRFVCQYHSWAYDLIGNLEFVPDSRDWQNLDQSCKNLIPVRCELWGNLIFLNQDTEAMPLLDNLGVVNKIMEQFQLDKIRYIGKRSWDVSSNWKVCQDAFMEVYHLNTVHPESVAQLLDHRGAVMALLPNGHSIMTTPNRAQLSADGLSVTEEQENTTADAYAEVKDSAPLEIETVSELARSNNLSFNFFPNIVTPLNPTGFPFLQFWPVTLNTCRMDVHWFSPDWGKGELPNKDYWEERMDLFDVILSEDTLNIPWIQQSLESPGFKSVPLNYQERRIYYTHQELDKVIGDALIPKECKVQPVLDNFIESWS